jgi:hypothetical protein
MIFAVVFYFRKTRRARTEMNKLLASILVYAAVAAAAAAAQDVNTTTLRGTVDADPAYVGGGSWYVYVDVSPTTAGCTNPLGCEFEVHYCQGGACGAASCPGGDCATWFSTGACFEFTGYQNALALNCGGGVTSYLNRLVATSAARLNPEACF